MKTPLEVIEDIAAMGCVFEVRCDKVVPPDHPCQGCVAREYLEARRKDDEWPKRLREIVGEGKL